MTTGALCQLCTRPTGDDAATCVSCAQKAAHALREVSGWLADDLVTVIAKQTTLTTTTGGKPTKKAAQPLPYAPHASEALAVLRSTLVGWVRVLADHHHGHLPANTVPAMAKWLAPVIGWARHTPYAPEMIDEILAAHHQAVRAVDRPIRRVPLHTPCRHTTLDGQRPITCGGQLYAILAPGHHTDGHIRCETDPAHVTTVTALTDRRRGARLPRLDIPA